MPQLKLSLVFRMPTRVRGDVLDRGLSAEDGVCVSNSLHVVCLQVSPNQSGAQGNCTDLPESDQQHPLWCTFPVSPGEGKTLERWSLKKQFPHCFRDCLSRKPSYEVSSTALRNGIARAAEMAAQA